MSKIRVCDFCGCGITKNKMIKDGNFGIYGVCFCENIVLYPKRINVDMCDDCFNKFLDMFGISYKELKKRTK